MEGGNRSTRIVRFADLKRDTVTFPAKPQLYVTRTSRVAHNPWDEVYTIVTPAPAVPAVALPVVLSVAA